MAEVINVEQIERWKNSCVFERMSESQQICIERVYKMLQMFYNEVGFDFDDYYCECIDFQNGHFKVALPSVFEKENTDIFESGVYADILLKHHDYLDKTLLLRVPYNAIISDAYFKKLLKKYYPTLK